MFFRLPKITRANVISACGTLTALVFLTAPAFGQDNGDNSSNNQKPVSIVQDWTDHHVVFSNPADPQKKTAIENDPRYIKQKNRRALEGRNNPVKNPADPNSGDSVSTTLDASTFTATGANAKANPKPPPPPPPPPGPKPAGDWSVQIGKGGAGTATAATMFPAKFGFDINAAPSCTQDFVVFAENATGATATAGSGTITFNGTPNNTGSLQIGNSLGSITYNFSTAVTLSAPSAGQCNIKISGTTTSRDRLLGAITTPTPGSNTTWLCTSATNNAVTNVNSSGSTAITMNSAVVGTAGTLVYTEPIDIPNITETPVAGVDGQPSIVALNNLYTGGAVAASVKGTFTGQPSNTDSITVTNGANVMTLQTNPSAKVATGTYSSGPASGTITLSTGTVVTLSPGGTPASVGGTFGTGTPLFGDSIALTGPSGSATFTSNGTRAQSTATFSGATTTGKTITINSLTLTVGGTPATLTGTFTATATTGSVKVIYATGSGTGSTTNTLTLTPTVGTASTVVMQWTSNKDPVANSTVAINGGQTYRFVSNLTSCVANDVRYPGDGTYPTKLAAAINGTGTRASSGTTADACTGTVASSNVSAGTIVNGSGGNQGGGHLTLTNATLGAAPNGATAFTASTSPSAELSGSANTWSGGTGTNGCTNSNTGTFLSSASANGQAIALFNAITSCHSTSAAIGVTAANPGVGAAVLLTADGPGSQITLATTGTSTNAGFSWTGSSVGTDGSNACSSSSAGTFVNDGNTTNLATNVLTSLTSCQGAPFNVPITSSRSGATVTVFTTAVGTTATMAVGGTMVGAGLTAWTGTVSPGSNGTQSGTCSAGVGNFGLSSTAATMAGFLVTAINACSSNLGLTATNGAGGAFTVQGAPGNFTLTTAGTSVTNSTFFNWGSVTPGTDGTQNACTSSSVGTYINSLTPATLGGNLRAALTNCASQTFLAGTVSGSGAQAIFTTTALGSTATLVVGGTIANPPFSWATSGGSDGSASCSSLSSGTYATSTNTTTLATNLAAGINACNLAFPAIGVTGTSNGAIVTATATSTGSAGNSITVSATGSNFSWANSTFTGGTGSGACNAFNLGQPQVAWSYDTHTSTGGPVTTSPTITLNGSMVAFVESLSTGSILHVLRPKPAAQNGTSTDGTVPVPVVVPTVINATSAGADTAWNTCLSGTGACMINLVYNTATNTHSSPFLDFSNTTIYVGDDAGILWKIINIGGVPKVDAGWTGGKLIHSGHLLTSPVYLFDTGDIYVGDDSGLMAKIHSDGTGLATSSGIFGNISDSPIVDNGTDRVFVFGRSTNANTSIAQLVQYNSTFSTNVQVGIGTGSSGTVPQTHIGAFSDQYFSGADSSKGFLYVCGKDAASRPVLYRIGFNSSGVMNSTTNAGPLSLTTASGTGDCSPLAEVFNPNQNSGTDWLFLGVPNNCAFGGPAGGCVMSFNITGDSTTSVFPTTAVATGSAAGGTSGIVVDNVSTSGHASSLYFTTLGTATCQNPVTSGGTTPCAVQFTQSGLQ